MKTFVILLVIGLTVSSRLYSQHAPTLAPLNPDFVQFMEKLNSGKAPLPGTDEFGTYDGPPPGQVSFDSYLKSNKLKSTNFDPVYDMRTTGLLTPVKGQTGGACWAFATMASVESRWLTLGLGTWDLSDNNLKYCHGFVPERNTWGNHWMSTAYFARRSGPLVEADDPNAASSTCPTGKIPVGYITDARYLPNDMNTIKQAILDYGAIYTMMYINLDPLKNYYNPSDYTYYYNGTPQVNHAVDLVGWDDGKITSGGNGAWICKNSYGPGWGEAGYFYISYNDHSVLDYNAYWPTRNDYKAEDYVYGYDELGNYNSIFYAGPVGYMLVKFVASDYQILSKTGTYAMASNTRLEIDIFDNFDTVTRSLSGLLSHTEGITCPMPGYYTSDLDVPVNMEKGNDFYVRIRYQTPDFEYPVPVEEAIPGYSDPVIESNIAWISADGDKDPWFLIGNTTDYKWDPCVKVYAETVISWTGAGSSDWNTPGNWSTNTIPAASQNVRIPNVTTHPLITQDPGSPAVCNHLTIEAGATLTIEAGKALTVNGNLTNNAGSTGLMIESDASLITMGNVYGTATVKRAVTFDRWHLISAPVTDAVSGTFSGKYLQKHTESTNAYTYITTISEAIVPLKGYALWSYDDYTANFTGHLNTGLTSIPLTRTSDDLYNSGWNLAGNPYPSSIDWDAAAGWTKDNVNSTIYRLTDRQWATYISGTADIPGVGTNGGSRYITPGQGFFVSVAAVGNGTLAMDNRVRVHNANPFFKSSGAGSLLRLKVSGNGYSDEAVVRFITEATAEFDPKYDASKLYGYNNESAQVYTLGSTPLTINSLPPGTTEVALGIRASTAGKYTIAATGISSLDKVTLEDTRTGVFTNLAVEPYTFIIKTGENEQRFRLHFSNMPFTGMDETGNPVAVIYGYNHTVHVNLHDAVKGDILIYTLTGQLAASRSAVRGMNSISLPGTGIYMVRVITAEGTTVKKVLVY